MGWKLLQFARVSLINTRASPESVTNPIARKGQGRGLRPVSFSLAESRGKASGGVKGRSPLRHSFARGWKISAISTPKNTAALMPAAVFVRPPVNAPKMPISCTARFTPVTSA